MHTSPYLSNVEKEGESPYDAVEITGADRISQETGEKKFTLPKNELERWVDDDLNDNADRRRFVLRTLG